uniref:Spermatogenesis associated 7 n=1 Tax=Amphilophus citrinellus TaxID=61819 RepID=A0A3Q0S376_AMPCI
AQFLYAFEGTEAFCPRSSSKLTQSIIKDHMVSHYKKVYSAKAAIDASVPKSLLYSVKCEYPSIIRLSVQYDDSAYLCSRSSLVSSPRFNTTFKVNEIVYPSCKVSSHHTRPASEMKYRSREAAFRRKPSACSLAASGDESSYKTFQDPVQKTYSGDLLLKHSQHFTQGKPFTPKTLKSDKSSYLSNYRYYRAPQRKPTQDSIKQPRAENAFFLTPHPGELMKWKRTINVYISSSRVSPDGGKSPSMRRVSAEEEELMYLEFISAVTEDILSRGHISDRVLDRVINWHIDMNRHQLDEGKMRHLLEVLRQDFEEPTKISTNNAELEKKENYLLDSLLPHLESVGKQVMTKEDNDLFSYVSLIKHCESPDYTHPLLVSTPSCSPERTASQTEITEKDKKSDSEGKFIDSPLLSEHVTDNVRTSEDHFHPIDTAATTSIHNEIQEYSTITSGQDQADDHSKEVEDLGRSLSESLHVSSNTHCENTASEQHTNTGASGSDDEF